MTKGEMRSKNALPSRSKQRPLTPLQERFLKSGLEGFKDREILELLLSLSLPPRECKRVAEKCIEEFKTVRVLLTAPPQELQRLGITAGCMFSIKLLHELPAEILKQKIIDQPVYKSSQEVFDYLYYSMRDLKKEVFKVIYLNSQNQIIDTANLCEGTLNSSAISPREVMENAIKHHAASLIFVHNHPSGNSEPSAGDKEVTRDLVYAGRIMQVKVLDHIIIGNNRYFSFAGDGLIEEYELDFINLRSRATSEAKRNRYKAKLSDPKLY